MTVQKKELDRRYSAYPANPIKRVVTAVLDKFPTFGRIKEHTFTTSLGANMTFRATDGKELPMFTLHVGTSSMFWSAKELRELAAELNLMADYLDKITK